MNFESIGFKLDPGEIVEVWDDAALLEAPVELQLEFCSSKFKRIEYNSIGYASSPVNPFGGENIKWE